MKKPTCIDLYSVSIIYLLLPEVIFLIGFCKFYIGIPLGVLLAFAAGKAIERQPQKEVVWGKNVNKKYICVIALLIVGWTVFSGVGGFVWQNTWDHRFRNALFRDLVFRDWPVIEGDMAACYYLGFWLPAALVGKAVGLNAGYLFQLLWAVLGISISFGLICEYTKEIKIRNMLIFIFFSGCDIVLYALFKNNSQLVPALSGALSGQHMELSIHTFNSSSNTTLLFWLYNQAVPFWVGFVLILLQKQKGSLAFIYTLLLLTSPLPCIGIAPFMVYLVLRGNIETGKGLWRVLYEGVKSACTFENIVSVICVFPILLFLKSNSASSMLSIIRPNSEVLAAFILYFLFEYGIYLIFVYPRGKHDVPLGILGATTIICSFIKMGHSADFAWRTCVPFGFYIMLLVMKEFSERHSEDIKRRLLLVFLICSLTPLSEMIRTTKEEIRIIREDTGIYLEMTRSEALPTLFDREKNACYDNFTASRRSAFFKYIAR